MNEIVLRPSVSLSEDWMILIFIFTLVTIAYTRTFHPLRIQRLWNSTWNVRILRQAIREEPNTPRANLLFNLSFVFTTALLIYLIIKYYCIEPMGLQGFSLYLLLAFGVFFAYAIKMLGIRAVKFMSDGDFGLTEYEYNVFLINRVIGLFLFPLVIFLSYFPISTVEPMVMTAVIMFGLLIVYRMLRGFLNAASSGVPLFYIFFYICTLEILPLVVCIRALLP